jgi:AAA domain
MPDDEPELELFDAGDEDGNLSPRQWLLGTAFCRTYLSGLVSAGAAGKTTFRILQALSLATGRPLSGEYVHKRSAASLRFALGPLSGSARLPMPRL